MTRRACEGRATAALAAARNAKAKNSG